MSSLTGSPASFPDKSQRAISIAGAPRTTPRTTTSSMSAASDGNMASFTTCSLLEPVTGISPNDLEWDSDPGTDVPEHRAGDEYTLEFSQPGVYLFQCKLHAWVHGEVIVADEPGNPFSNPGPRPPLNIDLTPPTLGNVKLKKAKLEGTKGTQMRASISEKGKLDAEYYRLDSKGHRVYNGYHEWTTFLGINSLRLAARWKHFKARPGRYVAVLRATDESSNTSKPVTKSFTIVGTPPPPTRRPGEES